MAFDGVTVASLVQECKTLLTGSRITKIAQPEADEILLTLKSPKGQYRLVLSASASLPLIYLTDKNKQSPMTAPGFCMLLRKHLANGRIVDITQPGLERIVRIHIEHLNELGDLCRKTLVLELMGKHSNLIFCDDKDMIIDSIKHISGLVSSVREVLPGRTYFIPNTADKADMILITDEELRLLITEKILQKPMPLYKAIYTSLTGISPLLAQEICENADLDSERPVGENAQSDPETVLNLFLALCKLKNQILTGSYSPVLIYENGKPVEYSALASVRYPKDAQKSYEHMSGLIEDYYAQKNAVTRIRQRSVDLRRIVSTALERNIKKYDLQCRQILDTEKRDTYRVYGELLHTYGYSASQGDKSLTCENFYTGETVTIPLDPQKTPSENAKHYFDKYGKMKRTYETLSTLTIEVKEEIDHLESIATALDIAEQEADLIQIREELVASGYIRKKGNAKKERTTSKPFHYRSSDGFDIFVGKNNIQNEELTFKIATGNDWWFHAKGIPGSHVIVKTGGKELPDRTFEEAARLAAHYSKGRGQEKVEIDYIEKKHVKKPGGGKPGFVVYYTNYSMMIDSDISALEQVVE